MNLLIKGATLVDPTQPELGVCDLRMENGLVAAIGENLQAEGCSVVHAAGIALAPGLIDLHVHLRDPGQTHKEDLASGAAAAAAGGVTTLCCMPNTQPTLDSPELIADVIARADTLRGVRILPVAAVSLGLQGLQAAPWAALAAAGAIGFSDDGRPVTDDSMMRDCLLAAKRLGLAVFSHSEDLSLPPDDPDSEANCVARDIALAESTRCPLHLCHISAARSIGLIRAAKQKGLPVTAETAPHYFTLTAEDVRGDTNVKMNPPLRGASDRAAILAALADGTIDAIATDHAPHAPEEKALPFDRAPNGVIGLETALALGITQLVSPGLLTLHELVFRMSTAPASILRVPGGSLKVGMPADAVLFDPAERWLVQADNLSSKSRNTPFDGKTLQGRVKMTLAGGRTVYQNGLSVEATSRR